jgi:hypothetical protein
MMAANMQAISGISLNHDHTCVFLQAMVRIAFTNKEYDKSAWVFSL